MYAYTLPIAESRRAGSTLRRVKGEKNRLIPIPIPMAPPFPTPDRATFVSLGWGIYVIGGSIRTEATSRVSFLDCRTHTWSQVPSNAGVLDDKIYVMGGCRCRYEDEDLSNWVEVFDPKMQTWSSVIIPGLMNKKVGKVVGWDSYLYNFQSEQGMWNDDSRDASSCAIDKLLYCYGADGRIMWCDAWSGVRKGRMEWHKVNGLEYLEGFLKHVSVAERIVSNGVNADVWPCYLLKRGYPYGLQGLAPVFKLITSGGHLFTFWTVHVGDHPKRIKVWCADISLERRHGGQIWGIIECMDHVFTLDPDLTFLYSFNVNL